MKTVVITGASRGIGRALAERFLKNGDFVIGTSTTGTLPISHDRLFAIPLDLSNPESIAACMKSIFGFWKTIDILINNAGIWSGEEGDPVVHLDGLRRVLEVNLFGTIDFTQQALPILSMGAHIVNVSSRGGSMAYTHHGNYPDYKISKAALNMFTRTLSFRLEGKATVSSVHPGWVKTDMGGSDADIEPGEAAEDIFTLANSQVESGQFWFKGENFPW